MSTALKNFTPIYNSCLRFSRTARCIKTPALLPRCAFLHSTCKLAVKITRQGISSDIFNIIPESMPISHGLVNIAPSDIIFLKEHLDSGNLSTACKYLTSLEAATIPPEGLSTGTISFGSCISDTVLQPVICRLFETLIADSRSNPDDMLPQPLELLKEMERVGVARTSHYTTLLTEVLSKYTSAEDILPIFEASISFSSENLRELMQVTPELYSLKVDTATPHFLAFLVLQEHFSTPDSLPDSLPESLIHLNNIIRLSPYPSLQHTKRFLDHHNFPSDRARNILSLLESYTSNTLLTNYHTLSQEVSGATTPEALTNLYTHVRKSATTPLGPSVYTRFMTSFLEMGCTAEGISCWDDMTCSGITPTVVEWNELMKAFSKNQSTTPLLQIWQKMLLAGCIPDLHCWTTRIHAFLANDKTAAGLASLREMREYGFTPTTETINAAIDGLLKHHHLPEAEAVLSTAQKLGIKKDIWTYNTLLRGLMKQQKTNSNKLNHIITLTREMQADNVVPDITTVTLILDGMYKYAPQRPSLESVVGLLMYIESVGISINTVTYTSIIHALLREGNEAAAMGILEVMAERGVMMNSATYTVLLGYYFGRSDLVSVERVLAEMEERRIRIDFQAYRMILCGFAGCGDTERMYEYLKLMRERGLVIRLYSYISVMKSLARRDLWLDLRNVIVELVDRGIVGSTRDTMYKTEEDIGFWTYVKGLRNGAVMENLQKEEVVEAD